PRHPNEARGAIFGLTRDTGPGDIVAAALEAVAFQTADLLDAMAADSSALTALRVDGGMVTNDFFCQQLSDLTGLAVDRPLVTETTAMGAAILAGLSAGWFGSLEEAADFRSDGRLFTARMAGPDRTRHRARWAGAVERILSR
ncbi:MAG: FGGY-family carbohydrate kinase, partial [Pseudomonadota bacterium]